MLDKRIDRRSILADAPGIKAAGFAISKIFFSGGCERDPVRAVR
jgi:hypothetical protein